MVTVFPHKESFLPKGYDPDSDPNHVSSFVQRDLKIYSFKAKQMAKALDCCVAILFEHTAFRRPSWGQASLVASRYGRFEPVLEQGHFNNNKAYTSKEVCCNYPQERRAEVEFACIRTRANFGLSRGL